MLIFYPFYLIHYSSLIYSYQFPYLLLILPSYFYLSHYNYSNILTYTFQPSIYHVLILLPLFPVISNPFRCYESDTLFDCSPYVLRFPDRSNDKYRAIFIIEIKASLEKMCLARGEAMQRTYMEDCRVLSILFLNKRCIARAR